MSCRALAPLGLNSLRPYFDSSARLRVLDRGIKDSAFLAGRLRPGCRLCAGRACARQKPAKKEFHTVDLKCRGRKQLDSPSAQMDVFIACALAT